MCVEVAALLCSSRNDRCAYEGAKATARPLMQGGCMAIEDAFVLGRELADAFAEDGEAQLQLQPYPMRATRPACHIDLNAISSAGPGVPVALKRYNQNRILRSAAVQGMSRLSSAILFQYNHPLELELWPPRLKNAMPKSIITRMGQGFLQRVAFPLQFEFLFDFPGPLGEVRLAPGLSAWEGALMAVENAGRSAVRFATNSKPSGSAG